MAGWTEWGGPRGSVGRRRRFRGRPCPRGTAGGCVGCGPLTLSSPQATSKFSRSVETNQAACRHGDDHAPLGPKWACHREAVTSFTPSQGEGTCGLTKLREIGHSEGSCKGHRSHLYCPDWPPCHSLVLNF